MDGITKHEEGWQCYYCGYIFCNANADNHEVDDKLKPFWVEKSVDAMTCSCGCEVILTNNTGRNISYSKFYRCDKIECNNLVSIKFKGKYFQPEYFLTHVGIEGLREVKTTEDKIAEEILFLAARKEESSFVHVGPKRKCELMWADGKVAGYYNYSFDMGIPILRQLYVAPEFRNKGYGATMIKSFIAKFSNKICYGIESPNPKTANLLRKIGLVNNEGKSLDPKLKFFSSGA